MIPLTLNWFGMAVHDVPAVAHFYSRKLGFSFWQDAKHGEWRYFETRCMTFELFEAHPQRPPVRAWGDGQAFRPAILVNDLSAAAVRLRDQGVSHSHEVSEFGAQVEMVGPEEIRWSLVESAQVDMDWAHPLVGGIELKAADLQAQAAFYTRVLGMKVEHETAKAIQLNQSNGEAWLRIEAGGRPTSLSAGAGDPSPAFFRPIWISYETKDVKGADLWLQAQDVRILHPLTYHESWNGTDIMLADADGNAIQVVEYGKAGGA